MYENVTEKIKKRGPGNLLTFLGIACVLLIIALALNISKYYRSTKTNVAKNDKKNTKQEKKQEEDKKPAESPSSPDMPKSGGDNLTEAKLSINGQTITVFVPKDTPLNFDSNAKLFLVNDDKEKLSFVPDTNKCPSNQTPLVTTGSINSTQPTNNSKTTAKKIITRRTVTRTTINQMQSSASASAYANSNPTSTSTSIQGNASASASSYYK